MECHHKADGVSDWASMTGTVVDVRKDGSSIPIPEGTLLWAGTNSKTQELEKLTIGDQVQVKWLLAPTPFLLSSSRVPWNELTKIISGKEVLVKRGFVCVGPSSARHPRPAVGLNEEGTKLVIVVVDGRGDPSVGRPLPLLAGYLLHIRAYDALNLDGGVSSAIAANVHGTRCLLSIPSDSASSLMV
ncbi:MAG: phosphodiester glycosidase family protein [Limnochordia bacterium]|nr:phosphodiester glycosidase family protein [Limnochordia bacterium]MDD2630080.1 phosphodiester glycosidase family protein [Limnochordia bacterium]MDD4517848.1 phosphodiester glycosidase family protein [Limnochordia bacterium]